MKVLIVHYRYFISGGPERYLFNVKEALENRGHSVIPFSIRTANNASSEYESFFAPNIGDSNEVLLEKYPKTIRTIFDLIAREFYSFKIKKCLKILIEKTHPDICYLLAYKRALSPSVIDACAEMSLPIVNRLSDYNMVCCAASLYRDGHFCDDCISSGDFQGVKYKCVKNSHIFSLMRYFSNHFFKLKRFDAKIQRYICTNEFMRLMMIKKGFSENKSSVLPTFFKESKILKSLPKENLIDSKIKFLFIGNMDESKGVFDLLASVILLKKDVVNFHLTMVGGLRDYENTKVKNIIDNNELTDFVTMEPFQHSGNVFEYYLKNNLTIIPARWVENLPNTLIESLYFNRPVVVPDVGSFKYTVDDSVAFKFDALSQKALAETLKYICQQPTSILQKSLNCKAFFNARYTEEMHINGLLNIFDEQVELYENF